MDPVVLSVLLSVGGFALGFGFKAAASWLRTRGKNKVAVAARALQEAMKTSDKKDDARAKELLAEAQLSLKQLEDIARILESTSPDALLKKGAVKK